VLLALTTGHEIGLIIVAAVFIAFTLASSFLLPRYKPDFPGPAGLSVYAMVSVVLFGLMVAAIAIFGAES
jgi:ABC-type transport system involved in multi-copper enzyme maturation permease subunit